jgi:hypothetical protein
LVRELIPDFPLRILSHAVDTVDPTGDTMPKPVITYNDAGNNK